MSIRWRVWPGTCDEDGCPNRPTIEGHDYEEHRLLCELHALRWITEEVEFKDFLETTDPNDYLVKQSLESLQTMRDTLAALRSTQEVT